MAAVLTVAVTLPWIEFLWHNLIGAVVVVVVGLLLSAFDTPADAPARTGIELAEGLVSTQLPP